MRNRIIYLSDTVLEKVVGGATKKKTAKKSKKEKLTKKAAKRSVSTMVAL